MLAYLALNRRTLRREHLCELLWEVPDDPRGSLRWSLSKLRQLVDDVESKLFGRLPDDTWFYPGHGNDSTLGAERSHLQEWRERGW